MKNVQPSGKTDKREIEYVALDKLTPYARNSRTHSAEQVKQIAASIREFGFTNPVLIDDDETIIAGHGRVLAAQHLQLTDVPCIRLGYLTETQRRAYVIADNKLALNAGWDEQLLKLELEELHLDGFDLGKIGFGADEMSAVLGLSNAEFGDESSIYTHKVQAPTYTPTGEKPSFNEIVNRERHDELIAEINSSNADDETKQFLRLAATRHLRFNYQNVAEWYAHQTPEIQSLAEASALVIIDFERAIELGYVKLTQDIKDVYLSEKDGVTNA